MAEYLLIYNHNTSKYVLINMNKIIEIENTKNISHTESKIRFDHKRNFPKTGSIFFEISENRWIIRKMLQQRYCGRGYYLSGNCHHE